MFKSVNMFALAKHFNMNVLLGLTRAWIHPQLAIRGTAGFIFQYCKLYLVTCEVSFFASAELWIENKNKI